MVALQTYILLLFGQSFVILMYDDFKVKLCVVYILATHAIVRSLMTS